MELVGLIVLVILAIVLLPFLAVALVTVALPVAWVWMLVDSILREPWEYPGGSENEKLLWIILMIVLQVSAVAYFFMVFRKIQRGSMPTPAQHGSHAAPPTAARMPPASA